MDTVVVVDDVGVIVAVVVGDDDDVVVDVSGRGKQICYLNRWYGETSHQSFIYTI